MRLASILLAVGMFQAPGLAPLSAQEIKLPPALDKLADKAEQSVDVTMNKSMLEMAAKFLSDQEPDSARTKKLLGGLESVTVRSFEFAFEGEYNAADVQAVRSQLTPPAWSRVVGVRSNVRSGVRSGGTGDNAEVYFKNAPNGQLGGVVVILAGPTQLTIVNVTGTLDPAQLADLGGEFGIPRLDVTGMSLGLGVDKGRREPK